MLAAIGIHDLLAVSSLLRKSAPSSQHQHGFEVELADLRLPERDLLPLEVSQISFHCGDLGQICVFNLN